MLWDFPLFRGWSPPSCYTTHPTQTDHTPTGGEIIIVTVMMERLALSYPTPDPGTWTGTQPIQGVGQRSGDAAVGSAC